MKVFFSCLISCLISVAAATAASYFVMQHVIQTQLENELTGINRDLDSLNEFVSMARSDTMRVYHFVAGHKSFSKDGAPGQLYCPECGLIMDLENRQTVVDNRIARLSARLAELKNDNKTETQEFQDGVKEINEMSAEVDLLQKHLFSRAAMEHKISTITNTPAPAEPNKADAAPKADK